MTNTAPTRPPGPSRRAFVSLVWDIVLNATIPLACYLIAKRVLAASEFTALIAATLFPTGKSLSDGMRHHELDPVAVLVWLGIVTSIVALFVSGDPRMLLVRESFFTGAFGIACLLSLVFPRPIMFYFARYFMVGKDPEQRRIFDGRWTQPAFRRAHRLVTTVWGLVYSGEFVGRVALVYYASTAVVLALSPLVMGGLTIATVGWTFWYAGRVRRRLVVDAAPPVVS